MTITFIIPQDIIIKYNYYHYNIAKEMLKILYKQKFNKKKILLKNELSFWSSFVNKKYHVIVDNYTEKDMKTLKREIELVAEFKLEECSKIYTIRKNMQTGNFHRD